MADIRWWGNQYGHGMVITGKTAELMNTIADALGEDPEMLVKRAIEEALERRGL